MLSVLLLTSLPFGVSAAGAEAKDGLEVTLLTDQGAYTAQEDIELAVSVKTTNAYAVENIQAEALLPQADLHLQKAIRAAIERLQE